MIYLDVWEVGATGRVEVVCSSVDLLNYRKKIYSPKGVS